MMKHSLCSYDMFAVPEPCYLLKDEIGEMYFCNMRCFAIWAVSRATRLDLSGEEQAGVFTLTTPRGDKKQMTGIVEVAEWATATAIQEAINSL